MSEIYDFASVFGRRPEDEEDDQLATLDQGGTSQDAPEMDTSALDALLDPKALDHSLQTKDKPTDEPKSKMEIGPITLGGLESLAEEEAQNAPSSDYKPAGALTGMGADLARLAGEDGQGTAPKDYAEKVMGDQPGERAFGVKDDRADLMARAARVGDLWSPEAAAEQTGPGENERAFIAGNHRPDEQAMRHAWMIQSLLGREGDNFKTVEMLRGMQHDYDQGLAQARALDQQKGQRGRRVDRATAEMLVLAGMSPEAAVATTWDSPVIKWMNSGGFNLGSRLRDQDTRMVIHDVGQVGDTQRLDTKEVHEDARNALNAQTSLDRARIAKRGGTGGGGGAGINTPQAEALFISHAASVPLETAEAMVAGKADQSTPKYEMMRRAQGDWRVSSAKDKAQMLKGAQASDASSIDTTERSAEMKRNDPVYRLKLKQEAIAIGAPLKEAINAYNSLSDKAKMLVAKVGLGGGASELRNAGLSEQEQNAIGAVVAQINTAVKAMSGAAVSTSEWQRLGAAMGVTGEGFSPFRSSSGLGAWLQRAKREYAANRSAVESEFPGVLGGK